MCYLWIAKYKLRGFVVFKNLKIYGFKDLWLGRFKKKFMISNGFILKIDNSAITKIENEKPQLIGLSAFFLIRIFNYGF